MAGLVKYQLLSTRNPRLYSPPNASRTLASKIYGTTRSEMASPKSKGSDESTAERDIEIQLYYSYYSSSGSRVSMKNNGNNNNDSKIVIPPRLCTLRAFGKNGEGVVKAEPDRMSSFFTSLAASIDHSAKIKDWEIMSGRLAMIVFAAAVNVEALTGNSLFHKMDVQKIFEFGGVCLASILSAAGLAWASRAKTQVADIFSARCNDFVDGVIDQLVDGLFYEEELD